MEVKAIVQPKILIQSLFTHPDLMLFKTMATENRRIRFSVNNARSHADHG